MSVLSLLIPHYPSHAFLCPPLPTTHLLSSTAYGHLVRTPAALKGKHSPGFNVADKTLTSARPT